VLRLLGNLAAEFPGPLHGALDIVALLNARAGVPSWGPELLARTRYALGSGTSTLDTMPGLYAAWERWAAGVTESHTTYLPLVRFRSPTPLSSWVTALLAVLDSAAGSPGRWASIFLTRPIRKPG
jgi:hypothetical protein